MAFIAADSYHSTIASIAGGTGITSFTVTSASGFPSLASGDFTVMRLDDAGTAEDIVCTAISGTTVTCLATSSAHANGNAIDGAILDTRALKQIKDDALSGFPENALSAAGALVKGTGVNNHITLTSAAATMTLADGTYKGELCRISVDRTSTKLITVDPAGSTTWDGALTKTLVAGDVLVGGWDGTEWKTIFKTTLPLSLNSYVAANWYWIANSGVSNSTAINNGVISWTPFTITKTITIDNLGARVSTAAAAGNFQCAIYADGGGSPTGSALCSTGNISTTSTGLVSAAVTAVQLQPGVYWFGVNADNATVQFMSVAGNSYTGFISGSSALANLASGTSNATTKQLTTQTFGTWPTNPTLTQSAANQAAPLGIFSVASVP